MTRLYTISGNFNESYAWPIIASVPGDGFVGRSRPRARDSRDPRSLAAIEHRERMGLRSCSECGLLTNKHLVPLIGLRLKRRNADYSITNDLVNIASHRFREVYESSGMIGLDFEELPADKEFYRLRPLTTVAFDPERRGTTFSGLCAMCGQFQEVIGATPAYLKHGQAIGECEFARTDIEFGRSDAKSFKIICGQRAMEEFNRANLRGIDFKEVRQ